LGFGLVAYVTGMTKVAISTLISTNLCTALA
jgi:hypothetical protein